MGRLKDSWSFLFRDLTAKGGEVIAKSNKCVEFGNYLSKTDK